MASISKKTSSLEKQFSVKLGLKNSGKAAVKLLSVC